MKSGRPIHHTPIKWIKVTMPDGLIYLKLDEKGNLIHKDVEPQHIVLNAFPTQLQNVQQSPIESVIPSITVPTAVTQPIIVDEDVFEMETEVNDDYFDCVMM
jgi:ABC-type dipeptide/oligopeptide/nickel transport system ATPase subunit